ncbi:hypothetical protein MMC07_001087 [Pseudocyphellaria aurata]|nr:hypothetical protein [Pseudocyphellaria aurata]
MDSISVLTTPVRSHCHPNVLSILPHAYADDEFAKGAGTNDAVLAGKDVAISGYVNDSSVQFNLGTEFPWYLELDFEDYTEWNSVQVSVGPPTGGFAIKDNKLVYKGELQFKGWLACDWSHGVTQLFWKTGTFNKETANCASVDLVTEKA